MELFYDDKTSKYNMEPLYMMLEPLNVIVEQQFMTIEPQYMMIEQVYVIWSYMKVEPLLYSTWCSNL